MLSFNKMNNIMCNCPSIIKIADIPNQQFDGKYVQQINFEALDSHLTLKLEKDKKKKSLTNKWEPPCDCEVVKIQRPIGNDKPKIVNAEDCDQIIFRTASKVEFGKKDQQQSLIYKIEPCQKSKELNGQCRRMTVYPGLLGESNPQEVHGDHITFGNQDIFLVQVQKEGTKKKHHVELELRTPKLPSRPTTPPPLTPVSQEITHDEKPQEIEVKKKVTSMKQKNKKKKK